MNFDISFDNKICNLIQKSFKIIRYSTYQIRKHNKKTVSVQVISQTNETIAKILSKHCCKAGALIKSQTKIETKVYKDMSNFTFKRFKYKNAIRTKTL